MRSTFTSLLACIAFLITINANGQVLSSYIDHGHPTSWQVEKSSYLRINGATNINRFQCTYDSQTLSDTLSVNLNYNQTTIFFVNKELDIPVTAFDCQNNFITKDFRKTLKAENYPNIKLSFKSINLTPELDAQFADGTIEIFIAGITRSYDIAYSMKSNDQGEWTLKGTQDIQLKDFGIDPPKKLMKLIQVKDQISVLFSLKLKQVPCTCP